MKDKENTVRAKNIAGNKLSASKIGYNTILHLSFAQLGVGGFTPTLKTQSGL